MAVYQRLEIWEGGDATVARFRSRRIENLVEIEEVGTEFYQLVDEGKHHRLIIDFSDVEYVSSALLGKLISLNAKVQARDGRLRLCSIRPAVLEIFHVCSLDRIFTICKDLADALPSF
jgi:anti-sigma B factor antagonist